MRTQITQAGQMTVLEFLQCYETELEQHATALLLMQSL